MLCAFASHAARANASRIGRRPRWPKSRIASIVMTPSIPPSLPCASRALLLLALTLVLGVSAPLAAGKESSSPRSVTASVTHSFVRTPLEEALREISRSTGTVFRVPSSLRAKAVSADVREDRLESDIRRLFRGVGAANVAVIHGSPATARATFVVLDPSSRGEMVVDRREGRSREASIETAAWSPLLNRAVELLADRRSLDEVGADYSMAVE